MRHTTLGIVFVLLTVGGLLQSCQRPNDPARMVALDSLIRTADSLAMRLDAIDTVALARMDSAFHLQRDGLEAIFTDTLQRDTALIVGNYYRAMKKSVNRALIDRRNYRAAVEVSRKQLRDLHRDASKGIWPEDKELAYYEQERIILKELVHSTAVVEKSLGTAQREWERGHAMADTLLARRQNTTLP
jgi:hypothetical protein